MPDQPKNLLTDLRGVNNLTIEAISGVNSIVESLHQTISSFGTTSAEPEGPRKRGISGFVYRSIDRVTRLVGSGLDVLLQQLSGLLGESNSSSNNREAILAAINGVLGDHLKATVNQLQIEMQFRQDGTPLGSANLNQQLNKSAGKLLILVHGSCMNDLQWMRQGHDHGDSLAREFGYTTIYLHYNTGLHISENGKQLSNLIESVIEKSKQDFEITILAHSMGGLVARSACHYAGIYECNWLACLSKLIFLGTPHLGAPLEKGGALVEHILELNPYSAPFSRLLQIRSSGMRDLHHGSIRDSDWKTKTKQSRKSHTPTPLPAYVNCYAIAASKSNSKISDEIIGDGLVTVSSALGQHKKPELSLSFPNSHQFIGKEMGHWDLLSHPAIYKQLRNIARRINSS